MLHCVVLQKRYREIILTSFDLVNHRTSLDMAVVDSLLVVAAILL
jgi:hypothetical protein